MASYILRRLLLIIPTLIGIMVINFALIQTAPGGPVEQALSQLSGFGFSDGTARITGSDAGLESGNAGSTGLGGDSAGAAATTSNSNYRGAEGLSPELIAKIEEKFGFDKPIHIRFLHMMGNYLRFDFGDSFFKGRPVVDLILEKMPVSISLGLWTTLIIYLISLPLGIAKSVRDGSRFDFWTSTIIIVGNAIPSLLFAILLIVLFAGGSYWDWFPLRGLTSSNWEELSLLGKIGDYFLHLALPLLAMVIGGFAGLTLLTKNSFLDEINKQYVLTAKAKGLTERRVLYGHVFRNAMLIVIAGFPSAFISILFGSSLIIEIIFSLDGLGLLGFEAVVGRDFPIVFGTLYFFTLLGLIMQIIGDIAYTIVDPRIDFEARAN